MTDERFVSVCFTGHRDLPEDAAALRKALSGIIDGLCREGMRIFYAGGAVGFDMMASEEVLKAKDRFGGIELRLLLPCAGHDLRWKETDRLRLSAIKNAADSVEVLSPVFTRWCMHERNRALADRSAVCVAYLRRSEGGTASTVRYASKKGLRVINVPDGDGEDLQKGL